MEKKYTPGKWEYAGGGRITTADEEVKFVAESYSDDDAHLISATPDLLEALEESNRMMVRIMNGEDWGAIEEQIQENEAAIAKAYGRE